MTTLHGSHAPPDTSLLTAELKLDLGARTCTGVLALLADSKALGSLAAPAA